MPRVLSPDPRRGPTKYAAGSTPAAHSHRAGEQRRGDSRGGEVRCLFASEARNSQSIYRCKGIDSLTEFLVESGRERAERLLADRTHFALGDADWRAFTAALDRPAEARPELARLFARPRPE
jgi:Protein of unknown function (DUF1778)